MVNAEVIDGLKTRLAEEAARIGFVSIGFAPAQDDPARAARLQEWLTAGFHGQMEWMEARAEVRRGPQSMWPEARSVIALGMSYAPSHDPLALADGVFASWPGPNRVQLLTRQADLIALELTES